MAERKFDFAEMSLHHLAHLLLSSSYLLANMLPYGTIISFLHDVSDICINGAKSFHLIGYKNCSLITFLVGQVIWLFMRCVNFPYLLYYIYMDVNYASDRTQL